jgi:hypothetical protein
MQPGTGPETSAFTKITEVPVRENRNTPFVAHEMEDARRKRS